MLPEEDHLIITEPDRYFNEALVILLIDWNPHLLDQLSMAVQGSKHKLAIHLFGDNDGNFQWLLDVANQADIIGINFDTVKHSDVIKGILLQRSKSFYFGRSDLRKIYTNYADDPVGKLLVLIGDKLSQTEE